MQGLLDARDDFDVVHIQVEGAGEGESITR